MQVAHSDTWNVKGPCRAVVLDLDGTLLDTEPYYQAAFQAAARNFGITFPPELYAGLIGLGTNARANVLLRPLGTSFPIDDFIAAYYRLRAAFLPARIPLCAGAASLLQHLHVPKAIATSASRRTALAHMRRAGLNSLFAHVVTRDDVLHGKPAPDTFLRAAALLDVHPSDCVAVEDSAHGVAAAHAAGMRVVMVGARPSPDTQGCCFARVPGLDVLPDLLGCPGPPLLEPCAGHGRSDPCGTAMVASAKCGS